MKRSNQLLLGLGLLLTASFSLSAQPIITRQPTNLSLSIGATAAFRVSATTVHGPISYQWRHEATPLLNATGSSLTLTNLQLPDGGSYSVAVTDLDGTSSSLPATLEVDPIWTKIISDPIVTDPGYDWFTGCWADLDGDGYLDLFLARYDAPGPNPIYHNNGDGTFSRVIESTLQTVQAQAWAYSWGDYDNDGHLDLFVSEGFEIFPSSRPLKNFLYHNNGDGRFTQVSTSPVAKEGGISSAGTWADYNRDGYVDLYVVNGSGSGGSTTGKNWLYRNQGDGTFLKLTSGVVGPIISEAGYFGGATWVDIDNDGWLDLLLVNTPHSSNSLYRNNAGREFLKVTNDPLVNEAADWGDAEWADYDNDGNLDVFLTTAPWGNSSLGPVALFHNDGQGHFTKMATDNVGPLAGERVNSYFCSWGDYDNDGWLDLFISNAWQSGASPVDLLYHNNGDGTFSKVTSGSPVNEPGASYSAGLVDLNNDGFLDLVTLKHPLPDNSFVRYFRNNGNSNNWLKVQCVGTASPRSATGTKVRVKATIGGKATWQLRVIDLGGFTMWQNSIAHFGLGDATKVDVLRIEWTSGIVQELSNLSTKQQLIVTEPAKLSMPEPGEMHIQCWKGMAYRIDVSPDLLDWNSVATVTNLTGKLQWTDPDARGQTVRFYRAAKL